MRPRVNNQSEFNSQPSNLKLTNDYYAKYEAISAVLDEQPRIIDAIHRDLAKALEVATVSDQRGTQFKFTSDTILVARGTVISGLPAHWVTG